MESKNFAALAEMQRSMDAAHVPGNDAGNQPRLTPSTDRAKGIREA